LIACRQMLVHSYYLKLDHDCFLPDPCSPIAAVGRCIHRFHFQSVFSDGTQTEEQTQLGAFSQYSVFVGLITNRVQGHGIVRVPFVIQRAFFRVRPIQFSQ
jgi:hypothetical protein